MDVVKNKNLHCEMIALFNILSVNIYIIT